MSILNSQLIGDIPANKIIESTDKHFMTEHQESVISRIDSTTDPTDGQTLIFNKSTGKYEPHAASNGSVTQITSTNGDITVTPGVTPQLTLNSGTGASQIVKIGDDGKLPQLDGSKLINLPSPATSYDATCITVRDTLGKFTSNPKNVENVLFELFNIANNANVAINAMKDSAPSDGDTLSKLRNSIVSIQTLLNSNDTSLASLQEIVNYIKSENSVITSITTSKVNVADVINDFVHTDTNKPASAYTVNQLYNLILTLEGILNNKVDQVTGKGLSSNDFTTSEKNKLDNLVSFSGNAVDVNVDSSKFGTNLTVNENTVQKALSKIDKVSIVSDTNSIMVHDTANNFKSTIKSVENIFAEMVGMVNAANQSAQKFLSDTYNGNILNTTMTTVYDTSTIQGTLVNAIVDIVNASVTSAMTYQFLINGVVAYQGIIPVGKVISFETQRTNLVMQVIGTGTITVNYKHIK